MGATEAQVAMVQAWVPHYRLRFFDLARGILAERGVRLHLFHGEPYGENAAKDGAQRVPWAIEAPNHVVRLGQRYVTWQSGFNALRGMDLVICEQAASQLLLYAVWGRYLAGGQRLALWGHGRNFQAGRASRTAEALKHVVSRRVHWWFAYNELSAQVVRALGFPVERITDLQNSIDTLALRRAAQSVRESELSALRAALGLGERRVGLYVGAMYKEKRLAYLLEACLALRQFVPDFQMVFVGTGPDAPLVAEAAAQHPWIHHVGPQFGDERVPYFMVADLHLMPGLVGLTLLDSFCLRTPLVTVADSEHSPEIAYLRNGENGIVLPQSTTPMEYAEAVAKLLLDEEALGTLGEGCTRASTRFTLENMSARFADGVLRALDAPLPDRRLLATSGPLGRSESRLNGVLPRVNEHHRSSGEVTSGASASEPPGLEGSLTRSSWPCARRCSPPGP